MKRITQSTFVLLALYGTSTSDATPAETPTAPATTDGAYGPSASVRTPTRNGTPARVTEKTLSATPKICLHNMGKW